MLFVHLDDDFDLPSGLREAVGLQVYGLEFGLGFARYGRFPIPVEFRGLATRAEVLYHYTNALAFESIANWTAELLASLLEKRTQFGEGVYASQHEPSVTWAQKLDQIGLTVSSKGSVHAEEEGEE